MNTPQKFPGIDDSGRIYQMRGEAAREAHGPAVDILDRLLRTLERSGASSANAIDSNRRAVKQAVDSFLEYEEPRAAAALRIAAGEGDAVLAETKKAVLMGKMEFADACHIYEIARAPKEDAIQLGDLCAGGLDEKGSVQKAAELAAFCYSMADAEDRLIALVDSLCAKDSRGFFYAVNVCAKYVARRTSPAIRQCLMRVAKVADENDSTLLVVLGRVMKDDPEFAARYSHCLE